MISQIAHINAPPGTIPTPNTLYFETTLDLAIDGPVKPPIFFERDSMAPRFVDAPVLPQMSGPP